MSDEKAWELDQLPEDDLVHDITVRRGERVVVRAPYIGTAVTEVTDRFIGRTVIFEASPHWPSHVGAYAPEDQ